MMKPNIPSLSYGISGLWMRREGLCENDGHDGAELGPRLVPLDDACPGAEHKEDGLAILP